jgi:hypothetical protein
MRAQGLSDVSGRLKSVTVAAEGAQVKLSGLSFGQDEIVPVLLALAGATGRAAGDSSGSGGAGE